MDRAGQILERHVQRFQNAAVVTEGLKALLASLHAHCAGDVEKVPPRTQLRDRYKNTVF